jgi:uncharacterized protein YndB with AHSA1/START domain
MFDNTPDADRELVVIRTIDVPRAKIYRCWTEPALLKQWFAPLPYVTPVAEMDVRSGGGSYIVMRGPDGKDLPVRGVYLEIVPSERIVFTDAYVKAWEPSAKPFMTGTITLEDAGADKTKYTALVQHWTKADRETHEQMGFHQGWSTCTDQLAALAKRI